MVHNGIEYGLMQAYAEGFDIFRNANSKELPEEHRYDLDLAEIAEVWRRGSVVGSWLLDLTAMALIENPDLSEYTGFVQDSGEGRWTVQAAIEEAVPADVLTSAALHPVPLAAGAHLRREGPLRDAEQVRRPRRAGRRAAEVRGGSRRMLDDRWAMADRIGASARSRPSPIAIDRSFRHADGPERIAHATAPRRPTP